MFQDSTTKTHFDGVFFFPPWTLRTPKNAQDQAATRLSEAETKMNGATEVHQSKAGDQRQAGVC